MFNFVALGDAWASPHWHSRRASARAAANTLCSSRGARRRLRLATPRDLSTRTRAARGRGAAGGAGAVFGVLVPTTFIAFVEILTLSGLLPAIIQVVKVQDLLHGIGLISAVGGALLATGAPDLRRLVVYSVISNLGAALVGIATLSGPGIIGALATVIVTGASASGQLLAAGTLERLSAPERPTARKAPLAALAFVVSGFAMIGAPPLLGFPGRFFMAYCLPGAHSPHAS